MRYIIGNFNLSNTGIRQHTYQTLVITCQKQKLAQVLGAIACSGLLQLPDLRRTPLRMSRNSNRDAPSACRHRARRTLSPT